MFKSVNLVRTPTGCFKQGQLKDDLKIFIRQHFIDFAAVPQTCGTVDQILYFPAEPETAKWCQNLQYSVSEPIVGRV